MPLSPFRRNSRGFTLIELLVVIAIISILASMLFPAFSRARESARKIVCVSNLKQISLGVAMYTQDYDEFYPNGYPFWAVPDLTVKDSPELLVHVLDPYIKSVQIWDCISWKGRYTNNPDYTGNYSFITDPANSLIGVPGLRAPGSLAGTNQPSLYPLLFCGAAPAQVPPDGMLNAHTGTNDANWAAGSVGQGGTSILYADGHAKFQAGLTIGRWNQIYSTSR